LNWYQFLEGEVAGGSNFEQYNRELINVETAFKKFAIHNRKDVYKYTYSIEPNRLELFKRVLDLNFNFNRFFDIGNDKKTEIAPFIYFSPETYINGYSFTNHEYMFTLFTLNKKTIEVIDVKFEQVIKMDNAIQ
jgi:hypothetical protein